MNQDTYGQNVVTSQPNQTSDEVLTLAGITEYTASDLARDFELAASYKMEQAKIFRLLDAADHSDVWKIYNKTLAPYIQTPVYNPITIIKEATKASIIPTHYVGEFRPMSMAAKGMADISNRYLNMKWDTIGMDSVNYQAGDYAFLHGTSGVLFGWNQDIIDSADSEIKFDKSSKCPVQAKAWHPSNTFPDPGAANIDEAQYLYFAERKTKAFLKTIPRFQNVLLSIEQASVLANGTASNYILDEAKNSSAQVVTFLTCYKRVLGETVNELGQKSYKPRVDVIYMAGKHVLAVSKDIKPSTIPFVMLYDEQIPNNFWGISRCYKVLNLALCLNMIDSIEATSVVKNQNPAQFINAQMGLNLFEYQQKRDAPDRAFTVNGDPSKVVFTEKRPDVSTDLKEFREYLIRAIQETSGVDSAYIGRSFGSIQTTGGVKEAIDRATMRDSGRIHEIDDFIKKEINLLLQFFLYNMKESETFTAPDNTNHGGVGQEMTFDPIALALREDIHICVSNAAPRTTASYEEAALRLMELEMKYLPTEKGYPSIITPEELVGWLNIPSSQKQVLLDRMSLQYQNLKLEEYTAITTAMGQLVAGGMTPENALQLLVQMVQQSPMGQLPAAKMPQGPASA